MWIFLNDAFLSLVADRFDSGSLLVRARRAGDIDAVFPGADVTESDVADYRFRATIPRAEVVARLVERIGSIEYPNFKDSVRDPLRHDAYTNVWRVMFRFQERARR